MGSLPMSMSEQQKGANLVTWLVDSSEQWHSESKKNLRYTKRKEAKSRGNGQYCWNFFLLIQVFACVYSTLKIKENKERIINI